MSEEEILKRVATEKPEILLKLAQKLVEDKKRRDQSSS
jgi:hypothetical protein